MESLGGDWYKKIWNLNVKNHSWVEDTKTQVDFLIEKLSLRGNERILDLACGFGRHSLELARRGFTVVGVDITKDFIEDAKKQAQQEQLSAEFILSDVRGVSFQEEFDAVLNMADGAVGYLENEQENLKVFDVVSKALKAGGRHFMDIVSADYADGHFPCQLWDSGEKGLTLSKFEWDKETKIMMYGQKDILYETMLKKPVFEKGCPTRLYHLCEVKEIMEQRNMIVEQTYSDFCGAPAGDDKIQMMVCSCKK